MKQAFDYSQWRIHTLAPTHIGTGEHYEPTEYLVQDGLLYTLTLEGLQAGLSTGQLKSMAKYALDEKVNLSRLRAQLYDQRESLLPHSQHCIGVSSELEQHYQRVVASVANPDTRAENTLKILRTQVNPYSNEPLLPGSSIKGAVRTALLSHVNGGVDGLQPRFGHLRVTEQKKKVREEGRRIELDRFRYRKVDEDPFRLLKVSDAPWETGAELATQRVIYAVNVPRAESKGIKGSYTMLETVMPGLSGFTLDLRLHRDLKGLEIPGVTNTDQLVMHVNDFYWAQFSEELERFARRSDISTAWMSAMQRLVDGDLAQWLESGQAMLLRLGRYGGGQSKTVDGARHIFIKGGRGKEGYYRDLPTTMWLAGESSRHASGLVPFGWCLLTRDTGLASNLQPVMKVLGEPASTLYSKIAAAREGLIVRREQFRQQQEAAARVQAAREKEEAEQQARLARMGPEQLQMEGLRERMIAGEGKGAGAGCALAQDLFALLTEGANWSAELRGELVQLAIEMSEHLGINRKKNKRLKPLLQALRQ